MKNVISILVILILNACGGDQDTSSQAVSVLYDVTGDTLPYNSEGIVEQFSSTDELFSEKTFRFQELTDVDINEVQQAHLSSTNEWLSNHDDRKKEVQEFEDDIRSIQPVRKKSYERSSLWIPMWKEIEYLHVSGEGGKLLYVISDLKEHSSLISMYDPKTVSQIYAQPELVRTMLRPYILSESEVDVHVVFIYQPKDNQDNQFFRQLIDSVYTPLFNECGIAISQKASL